MDSLIEKLAKLKIKIPSLRGDVSTPSPEDDPYDPMGRGMSPETALRLEALGNRFAWPGKYESLIEQGIYPVRPEFIDKDYKGSGTYNYTGSNEDKILLNIERPWWGQHDDDSMEDIIAHELRHRETGGMGGVVSETAKDKFIQSAEPDKWRLPSERYAYGGDATLLKDHKYYIPGDLQRILAGREVRIKSK